MLQFLSFSSFSKWRSKRVGQSFKQPTFLDIFCPFDALLNLDLISQMCFTCKSFVQSVTKVSISKGVVTPHLKKLCSDPFSPLEIMK